MGTDIYTWAVNKEGKILNDTGVWVEKDDFFKGKPFGCRNYGLYGWLADVRNYSELTPIAADRGWLNVPEDVLKNQDEDSGHSHSWVSIDELSAVDYDTEIIDKRHKDKRMSLREFLGKGFFMDLSELNRIGASCVWFCFSS